MPATNTAPRMHDLFIKTVTDPLRLPVLHKVMERLVTMAPRTNVEETSTGSTRCGGPRPRSPSRSRLLRPS
jgi:hypothetical protein